MAENQSSEPSKPEELPDSSPEADPSSSSIEAPSEGAPKTLDSDDKSFSELLAGAIACPINSIVPASASASASGSGVHTVVLSLPATTTRFMQMPLDSPENFPSGQGNFEISHQQALANVTAQAARAAQKHFHGIHTPGVSDMIPSPETSGSVSVLNATPKQVIGPVVSGDSTTMPEKWQLTVSDPKFEPFHILDRPIHDVYNWRKYGQKQVKGSEYPRSYYKCTHHGCTVKKMVVCSFDGLVTEVIYKGEHSHEPPSRKRVVGFSFLGHGEGNGALDVLVDAVAGGSANGPDPSGDPNGLDPSGDPNGPDPSGDPNRPDPSGDPNGSDPSGPVPSVSRGEQGALDVLVNAAADGTVNGSDPTLSRGEQSSENAPGELVLVSSNHEEDGNAGARDYEVHEDEPDLKRRNAGNGIIDLVPSQRAVREPRVVVQTTSDLEILFDGYRWRKYGQKIIKGNPNPRSYYKCTSMGCPVRKHVERSSDDPKAVITTYEGKHSHDIPGSKYSIYVPHSITTAGKLPAPTTVSTTDKNPSSRESLETEIRDGAEKAQADILTSNELKNDHGGEKVNANNPVEGGSDNINAIQDGSGKAIADEPTDHDQPMELDSNSSEVDGESKNPKRKIQRLLLDENHVPVSVSIPNA